MQEPLHHLDFTGKELEDTELNAILTEYVSQPLETVLLDSNKITKNSADALALLLEQNETLQELSLSQNYLATEGTITLLHTFFLNSTLKILKLESNHIQSKILVAMHDVILNNDSLIEIYLGFNALDDAAVKAWTNSIRTKKVRVGLDKTVNSEISLKTLDVAGNELTDTVVQKLQDVLAMEKCSIFTITSGSRLYLTDDAFKLAKSRFGPATIAESINALTDKMKKKLNPAMKKKNGKEQTLLEVLLRNQYGTMEIERREETAEDIYESVKTLVTESEFDLFSKDSIDRTFHEVMIHHENDSIRNWCKKLNAIDGRFKLDDSPPIHISKTCEVIRATDNVTGQRGVLKIFNDGADFNRELVARKGIKDIFMKSKAMNVRIGNAAKKASKLKKTNAKRSDQGKKRLSPVFRNKIRDRRRLDPVDKEKVAIEYNNSVLDFFYQSQDTSSLKYLFFEMADKNLFEIMNTERIAGLNLLKIKEIARQAAKCLRFVNENKFIHGDFKPRNFVRVDHKTNAFKLIDFDASVQHGRRCGQKYSSAYVPPEMARWVFLQGSQYPISQEWFDVWSFGVVLFELLSGASLFESMKVDDNLFSAKSKASLINWLEISDDKIDQVLDLHDQSLPVRQIAIAKTLVRWCLQRKDKNRPNFRQIVNHPFLSKSDAATKRNPVGMARMMKSRRNHLFLSHIQSQASGTVKDLYYSAKQFECSAWLDMKTETITQESMYEGVSYCSAFVVALTRDTFFSVFCLKELIWALDFKKTIIFVVEVDPREFLFPFDLDLFLKKFDDDEFITEMAAKIGKANDLGLSKEVFKKVDREKLDIMSEEATVWILKHVVKPAILETLESNRAIPYRRREYENVAMFDCLLEKIGFISPNAEILQDRYRDVSSTMEVNPRNSVVRANQKTELMENIRNNGLKARQNWVRGGRTKSGRFNIKLTDGEFDKIGNAIVFVMVGENCQPLVDEVKARIFNYLPLAKSAQQWIEIPHDTELPEKYHKKLEYSFTVVSIMSPGFFHTKHRESFRIFEDSCRKQRRMFPNIMVENNWFKAGFAHVQQELGPEFEHLLLHTEVMPYRSAGKREYEHVAMVREISRKILSHIRQ